MRSIEEGWLKPQISRVFPLEDAIAAHQLLENRNNMGKILLKISAIATNNLLT
ncbi:MAG: zinc-binding dehydrogenase [Pleurocapsa sp. MO_226.B13]|nr:zinc-binding dehydrogenase [Pleurocapsa sp. MO_226.B13]